MGPVFIIITWLMILAFFYLALGILWVLYFPIYQWGKLYDNKAILLIGRIPGFLAKAVPIGLILIFTLSIGQEIALTTSPSYAFKSTFGFSIDPDTEVLKNYRGALFVTDYQKICLKLRTNQKIVDQITGNKFERLSREEFASNIQFESFEPNWFKPLESEPTQFFKAEPYDDDFASNSAFLCFNETSGICFFQYIGVD
jgi:hypothetical protein